MSFCKSLQINITQKKTLGEFQKTLGESGVNLSAADFFLGD
jgi:hypothetical protein